MAKDNFSERPGGRGWFLQSPLVKGFREFVREHRWAVLGVLWLVAYALGCYGAFRQFAATGEQRSPFDPFYRAFQLFLMDDSMVVTGPRLCWQLEVARFLAPAVAASAAVTALVALFRDQLQMFRLRYCRQHVVICGLGRKGLVLASDFRKHGDRVVVVERDGDDKGIATCRALGITVLVGDATERAVLEKARIAAAKHVIAICGADGTNAEIALLVYQIIRDRGRQLRGTVRGFIHIVDLRLCELFAQHRVFSDFEDYFDARIFNIYENSARMLFEDHPPDRGQIVQGDARTAHLILLGFGRMGEAVALQLARAGHYASGKKPRLTMIDREAQERKRNFASRYPQFEQVCSVEFLTGGAEDPETLEQVYRLAGDPDAVATVVVTLDDDSLALSCALSILAKLADRVVPLVVRMSDDAGLATLLDTDMGGARTLQHIHPFGMPSCACTRRMLSDELDVLARAIHENYVQERRQAGQATVEPSTKSWEQLDPGLRDSNRQQADHLRVKLRAIGCYGSREEQGGIPVPEFSDDEVELLARMEHARWNAERYLTGWRLGPKDVRAKTSPYLVAWEDLPVAIQEYDRQAVRQIPRLLERIGEKIYRHSGSPQDRSG